MCTQGIMFRDYGHIIYYYTVAMLVLYCFTVSSWYYIGIS